MAINKIKIRVYLIVGVQVKNKHYYKTN